MALVAYPALRPFGTQIGQFKESRWCLDGARTIIRSDAATPGGRLQIAVLGPLGETVIRSS